MLSDVPQVVVVNESTVVDTREAWRIAWALGYSVRWQFGPLWKISADISLLPSGMAIPAGASALHLLDTADQESALGYHDEDGMQIPYSRVFAKTSLAAGVSVCEVADHECKEMLVNPHVNATAWDPVSARLFPLEVGDPAQGGAFDLADPYRRPKIGMTMSDFVLPSWFDPTTPADQVTSFRGVCRGPFSMGVGGYFSYTSTLPPNWKQQFGEHANRALIEVDERVRRLAA